MDKFSFLGKKKMFGGKSWTIKKHLTVKKNGILFIIVGLAIFGSIFELFSADSTFYAYAYSKSANRLIKMKSPIFDGQSQVFADGKGAGKLADSPETKKQKQVCAVGSDKFAKKIYAIVGDAPIREMVPFISERSEKVAAFIVGIAKKESGLGEHSPLKDGETCYNYWGYKGSAGRGTSMGYACFASAEEAVEIVGNRIEVLVNKNRTTPAIMVHTWKCGTSCAGDAGAPSWVSTVAAVFDKILS